MSGADQYEIDCRLREIERKRSAKKTAEASKRVADGDIRIPIGEIVGAANTKRKKRNVQ